MTLVGRPGQRTVPPREAWSANGALENPELMAEREVLEGDGRRPEEQGAEKRPDTDHKQHGGPLGIRHGVRTETLPDQRWR